MTSVLRARDPAWITWLLFQFTSRHLDPSQVSDPGIARRGPRPIAGLCRGAPFHRGHDRQREEERGRNHHWRNEPRLHGATLVHGMLATPSVCAVLPATRREFWKAKIEANAVRDQVRIHQLRELGWRVAVVWECGLREAPKETLADLEKYLVSGNSFVELPGIKKQLCKRLRRPDALTKVGLHCQPV